MPYCLIALLPYCLIALLAISLVACKGNGGGSSNNSSTTTTTNTPLQGTWANTTDGQTYVFNGTAIAVTQTGMPNPSDLPLSNVSMTVAGTFRLDSGNIYVTPTSIVVAVAGTPMSQADQNNYLTGNPLVLNTERLWGTYAVNGNTLTITQAGSSTPDTFTKQ